MRGHLFCLPLGTCSVPRKEQSRPALKATDSARSKTRIEPLLYSKLWLLAGHIAGLAAFFGLQSVVSIKGEKSEVGGAGGQSKWQVTRRLGKKQNGEEPGCLPNPGSHDLGLPRLEGLWGNGRGTPQVGDGPGEDCCPGPELR